MRTHLPRHLPDRHAQRDAPDALVAPRTIPPEPAGGAPAALVRLAPLVSGEPRPNAG